MTIHHLTTTTLWVCVAAIFLKVLLNMLFPVLIPRDRPRRGTSYEFWIEWVLLLIGTALVAVKRNAFPLSPSQFFGYGSIAIVASYLAMISVLFVLAYRRK